MNVPPTAGSGTMLRLVPRTSNRSRSFTGTGCANVSVNVRLSRSPAGTRSSSWVSGSAGIGAGRCDGACTASATTINTHSTSLNLGSMGDWR